MSLRVVSVTGPGMVKLKDNAVLISKNGEDVGKIQVEDMAALLLDGPDLLLSHQLLSFCAEKGVAVISSDPKHMPSGIHLPFAGHSLHSATLRAQIDATVPAKKRAWQMIVKAKIRAQADLVRDLGGDEKSIRKLIPLVRSGDPDNVEATAAARYFGEVFGASFTRNRETPGINGCLNYGYAIIRSAVARAIVGSGLHPALGIFHRNQYNPFCLVDDAMEPFRPMVDRLVWQMTGEGDVPDELDPPTKRRLVTVMGGFVWIGELRFPLLVGLERFAAGLRRAICDGEDLEVPIPAPPPEG